MLTQGISKTWPVGDRSDWAKISLNVTMPHRLSATAAILGERARRKTETRVSDGLWMHFKSRGVRAEQPNQEASGYHPSAGLR
jgi:hypothetical protein